MNRTEVINSYDELTNQEQDLIDGLINTLASFRTAEREKLGEAIEQAIEDIRPKRKNTLIWIALDSGTWGDPDSLVIATLRDSDDIDQWSDSSIIDFGERYGHHVYQTGGQQ